MPPASLPDTDQTGLMSDVCSLGRCFNRMQFLSQCLWITGSTDPDYESLWVELRTMARGVLLNSKQVDAIDSDIQDLRSLALAENKSDWLPEARSRLNSELARFEPKDDETLESRMEMELNDLLEPLDRGFRNIIESVIECLDRDQADLFKEGLIEDRLSHPMPAWFALTIPEPGSDSEPWVLPSLPVRDPSDQYRNRIRDELAILRNARQIAKQGVSSPSKSNSGIVAETVSETLPTSDDEHAPDSQPTKRIRYLGLTLDLDRNEIFLFKNAEKKVTITAGKERKAIELYVRNKGRNTPNHDLLDSVWGEEGERHPKASTVNGLIHGLNTKLSEFGVRIDVVERGESRRLMEISQSDG